MNIFFQIKSVLVIITSSIETDFAKRNLGRGVSVEQLFI